LERFLALSAGGNIIVAQPTTSAQLFHLLRYQARYSTKPLIVAAPKSLLRAKQARSQISEFTQGLFRPILEDPTFSAAENNLDYKDVNKLIICSGKIAYELIQQRDALLKDGNLKQPTAIIRLERLYPFPRKDLTELLGKLISLTKVVFVQDEPDNMGTLPYCTPRILDLIGNSYQFDKVSRIGSGSPATGSAAIHTLEQKEIMQKAFD
jgi:2-oxoglutarate dehydrogenase E1 component